MCPGIHASQQQLSTWLVTYSAETHTCLGSAATVPKESDIAHIEDEEISEFTAHTAFLW